MSAASFQRLPSRHLGRVRRYCPAHPARKRLESPSLQAPERDVSGCWIPSLPRAGSCWEAGQRGTGPVCDGSPLGEIAVRQADRSPAYTTRCVALPGLWGFRPRTAAGAARAGVTGSGWQKGGPGPGVGEGGPFPTVFAGSLRRVGAGRGGGPPTQLNGGHTLPEFLLSPHARLWVRDTSGGGVRQ